MLYRYLFPPIYMYVAIFDIPLYNTAPNNVWNKYGR